MEHALEWISHYGYIGLFFALLLGIAGLPIPDETLLVFYGYLIATGHLSAAPAFASAMLGSICGISMSYWIGRTAGYAVVIRYGRYLHISPEAITRVHNWFARVGRFLLTIGYFIVGVRHVTALVAGMSKLEFPVFAAFAYPGAVLWSAAFLALGYYVGEDWRPAVAFAERFSWSFAVALAVAGVAFWAWRHFRKRSRT